MYKKPVFVELGKAADITKGTYALGYVEIDNFSRYWMN